MVKHDCAATCRRISDLAESLTSLSLVDNADKTHHNRVCGRTDGWTYYYSGKNALTFAKRFANNLVVMINDG